MSNIISVLIFKHCTSFEIQKNISSRSKKIYKRNKRFILYYNITVNIYVSIIFLSFREKCFKNKYMACIAMLFFLTISRHFVCTPKINCLILREIKKYYKAKIRVSFTILHWTYDFFYSLYS